MSLLMEALRKAEEAKRGASDSVKTDAAAESVDRLPLPDTTLDNEQADTATAEAGASPRLAPEALEDPTTEQPEPTPAEQHASTTLEHNEQDRLHRQQNQHAANSLFLAKQAARRRQQQRRRMMILLGGLLLLPLAGGSFYLWYTLTASPSGITASADTTAPTRYLGDRRAVTDGSVPSPTDSGGTPPVTETGNASGTGDSADGEDSGDAPLMAGAVENGNTRPAPPEAPASESPTETQTSMPGNDTASSAGIPPSRQAQSAEQTLQLTSRETTLVVTPELSAAYEHFLAGRLPSARAAYLSVLENDPENRDAILGLAAIERRQGDSTAAQRLYARLLTLNPRDPMARTGLIETARSADPLRRESDLRQLEEDHPRLAAISFALGNLHAGQQRWRQAQNAYFDALRKARQEAGPVSPDYAFNLAISLEQLGEPALALDYYREAAQQARQVAPGFDHQTLLRRIQALEDDHER